MDQEERRVVRPGDMVRYRGANNSRVKNLVPGKCYKFVSGVSTTEWVNGQSIKTEPHVWHIKVINEKGVEGDYSAKHFEPEDPNVYFDGRAELRKAAEGFLSELSQL